MIAKYVPAPREREFLIAMRYIRMLTKKPRQIWRFAQRKVTKLLHFTRISA